MEQDEGACKGTSLWNTTLKDIKEDSFPTKEQIAQIEQAVQDINDNNIDHYKPNPEIEKLANVFKPQPTKFVFPKPEEEY